MLKMCLYGYHKSYQNPIQIVVMLRDYLRTGLMQTVTLCFIHEGILFIDVAEDTLVIQKWPSNTNRRKKTLIISIIIPFRGQVGT